MAVCCVPLHTTTSMDPMPDSKEDTMAPSLPESLPIDDTIDFSESVDDSYDASARTLASTTESYRFENGRRYHAYRDGSYWGPNDEKDSYHQIITHHLWCLSLEDRLFLAPIKNPQNVIDIGTGRGLWAMDFADQYPDANVIGTDLSPVWEPSVQPNLRFEVDDCCSEWTYPAETKERFDFIHMRLMYGSVADWKKMYKDCYDHLVPGGYLEQAEAGVLPYSDDNTLAPNSVFHKWTEFSQNAQKRMGKALDITETMKDAIIEAGFEDVVEVRYKWPLGPWTSDPRAKEIGRWNRQWWEHGMEGWAMAVATRNLKWTREEVRALLKETKMELYESRAHVYYEAAVVYGRKPLKGSASAPNS